MSGVILPEESRPDKGKKPDLARICHPVCLTYAEMMPEAEKLAAISPNFVIKIQCVEPAFKVIEALAAKDIRVNCTLIFSAMQALQAMRSGGLLRFPLHWLKRNQRRRD
jgi:transaldolase